MLSSVEKKPFCDILNHPCSVLFVYEDLLLFVLEQNFEYIYTVGIVNYDRSGIYLVQ